MTLLNSRDINNKSKKTLYHKQISELLFLLLYHCLLFLSVFILFYGDELYGPFDMFFFFFLLQILKLSSRVLDKISTGQLVSLLSNNLNKFDEVCHCSNPLGDSSNTNAILQKLQCVHDKY